MVQKTGNDVDRVVNEIKKTSRDAVAVKRIGAPRAHVALLDLGLEKFDKEQDDIKASERHAQQIQELEKTRSLQEKGNTIQRWILVALVVTVLVTIVLAKWK